MQYSIILHLPHSTKMKEEEETQGNCLQVCTCTWVAYQCHMSDKSLKLPLGESVSVLLVVSNPRRQVATFRKKVILEKLERKEEKRREWWGGGKRERKRGGDRKRKRRGGEEKKRRGKGGGRELRESSALGYPWSPTLTICAEGTTLKEQCSSAELLSAQVY